MKAGLHRLASTQDKLASEASRPRRSAVPISRSSKCDSCVLAIKALKNGTFRNWYAPFADTCQLAERLFHRPKASDLGVYIGNLGFGPSPNVSTRCRA